MRYYLFLYDFLWHLYPGLDYFFVDHVYRLQYFLILNGWHDLFSDDFDFLVDWYLDISDDLYLHNSLLDYGHVHLLNHLLYLLDLHDSVHYPLYNLRHLHNLLHYPGHHHYLLHDFFNFDDLRNFH